MKFTEERVNKSRRNLVISKEDLLSPTNSTMHNYKCPLSDETKAIEMWNHDYSEPILKIKKISHISMIIQPM